MAHGPKAEKDKTERVKGLGRSRTRRTREEIHVCRNVGSN